MSSSVVITGFDTMNGGVDDDKFELQFALRKPVVDHQSLENHTLTSRQGFSIRGFVAQVRSKDISKCWPFSEGLLQRSLKEGKRSLFPPLDSPQHGTASGPERLCETHFTVPLLQNSQDEKEDDINGGLQENQSVTITVENEDFINSQTTKADSLKARECLDIVREDSSTAVKSCRRPWSECNDAVSNGHRDHCSLELSDTLAEVTITEIGNANGDCWKKNLEAEGCDIGDATKNHDAAGSVDMKVDDLEEDELVAKECATTSSAINAVEEHTDNCLSKKMSTKSKAQKKRRSIADIFACAPPVRTCGNSSSSEDVFVRSCPSPLLPLPFHRTDVLCALDSAKVNPFVSEEMIEIPPPSQPQVGSKSKRKKRRVSVEERHGPCSSSATRLKDMIKSIVKHPRKERSFLKIAKEPCKSADDVDEVNPNGTNPGTGNSNEAEVLADPDPKKKKRHLSGNSGKILKRNRIKTLAFQHSPKDQHVGTSENVQSYVEMPGLKNKSNGLPRPNDAKRLKKRSSIIKKKQEPAKKQKPDMFLRDSKGRFAKITAVDNAKHVRRKGYRKLRREKQDCLKHYDSSVHKDTNFAINLALSNARLRFLNDKAQTPSQSPCIDANTNLTKHTEIPDLNAVDDTDQGAFATTEKQQTDSALELSLHRKDSLQMENTLSRECQSLGWGIVGQSSVAESNERCYASSIITDPEKLHLVNRMNLASTETTLGEGMLLSHQKIQRPCSQGENYNSSSSNRTDELLSVTHASTPDCQDLFRSSSPQGDESVLGCQETTKVVRLMGKSLVIDTESVPQLNHGHTGFDVQPGATHRSKPLFDNLSPANRDPDTNELDLLQALESKHCTAEEQEENPNNQFPEDIALSQPMKQNTTPPLRSKTLWLPRINAAINGRRSDFWRSRFSGESHGIPKGYGGEKIGVRDEGSRSPVLLLGRRDSLSLSQSTVRDRSAHSIYGQDLSNPCGYLVRDGQPQNATFPASRYASAATIGPSTFRRMHDQETVCIARDSGGVNLPLEPSMDVVFPVCVYDASVLPCSEPPGRYLQTSINSSFAYRDCHESRLKSEKERCCVIEDGRTVNLIDKLHGGLCKDVYSSAGVGRDVCSRFSGNQVESPSASQVDPSTVIDLTNDSEEEKNESGDDGSRVRSSGKRRVRFVEADRFQPNCGVVFGNNLMQSQPRKLSGSAKHILTPSSHSSSSNRRPSALDYVFPFALEGKSMYVDH